MALATGRGAPFRRALAFRFDPARSLARDGGEHAIKLLDPLNAPWTLVDAPWTSKSQSASALKTKATAKQGES